MARYKMMERESGQGLFIVVNMRKQLIPGTYEWTLNEIIEKKIDMSGFDGEYKNDREGRPAINPRALLKLVLYGYSKGIVSSRRLEKLGRENIVAEALAGEEGADHGTIAAFVSGNSERIKKVFVEVLMVCDEMDLIGGEMFAVDGCRLPSNAGKEWSGSIERLQKKAGKFEKYAREIVERHHQNDANNEEAHENEREREKQAAKKLMKKAKYIQNFLEKIQGEKRIGVSGKEVQSNVTDNESAKIKGPHGVIQGYNGLAAADSKSQVVVAAEASGADYEGGEFGNILTRLENNMKEIRGAEKPLEHSLVLADTNYFSETNLEAAAEKEIEVIIPDAHFRSRDGRFDGRPGHKEKNKDEKERMYTIEDFTHNDGDNSYTCPRGKKLEYRGKNSLRHGRKIGRWSVKEGSCAGCPVMGRCIRARKGGNRENPRKTLYLNENSEESLSAKMRKRIDSDEGRTLYSYRAGIIEPCFANIEYCKGMNRFTLRGKGKVNGQWLLYCIVHNIGKCVPGMTEKYAA